MRISTPATQSYPNSRGKVQCGFRLDSRIRFLRWALSTCNSLTPRYKSFIRRPELKPGMVLVMVRGLPHEVWKVAGFLNTATLVCVRARVCACV